MGLTAEVEMSLMDAGLVDFHDRHEAEFMALAKRAYTFAYENVIPTGLPLRKDDVATGLVTALLINEHLRDYLGEHKLRPRYWYQRFADLILDRQWEELTHEHDKQNGA